MDKPHYAWKRFWSPRASSFNLQDGGYLTGAESFWGVSSNPHLRTFDQLSEIPCLILLGEPGIGKTTAIEDAKKASDQALHAEGHRTLWVNLNVVDSQEGMNMRVFEHETFRAWRNDASRLYLYLDSLDECLLRVDTVAELLEEQLADLPVERLYLRIACRTAVWPQRLENSLTTLYTTDTMQIRELALLSQTDIVEAAKVRELNAEEFLREIVRSEVMPLAIKPLTLKFLLDVYMKENRLPSTQTSLYHEGCQCLCEEHKEHRRTRGSKLKAESTRDQRLLIAGRIAALTVFCNRNAIYYGTDEHAMASNVIPLSQISGSQERCADTTFYVTVNAIQETLDTGLFSSGGGETMVWRHRTYAEFLAAWYINERGLSLAQMMLLITHPNGGGVDLVPQLHETAAWLAGMVPEIFRAIMDSKPAILIGSDVAMTDMALKETLIDKLLAKAEQTSMALTNNPGSSKRLSKLSHSNLVDQLRPYINNRNRNEEVRNLAIEIGWMCEASCLVDDLVSIALNQEEIQWTRILAARGVVLIGDSQARGHLLPLAIGESGDDPDDQLKGYGLRALWPAYLSVHELLPLLTAPKRIFFYGSYAAFMDNYFEPGLETADIPTVLDWITNPNPNSYYGSDIVEKVLERAWKEIDSSDILAAYTRLAIKRMLNHDQVFIPELKDASSFDTEIHDGKRRLLIAAIIAEAGNSVADVAKIASACSNPSLIPRHDLEWLTDQEVSDTNVVHKLIYAKIIFYNYQWCLYRGDYVSEREILVDASLASPTLREELKDFLDPVVLGSERAERMKTDYAALLKLLEPHTAPLLDPTPQQRILACLEAFDAGNLPAWPQLTRELTLESDSRYYSDSIEPDLTTLPGWLASDDTTKNRLLAAAEQYVRETEPAISGCFEDGAYMQAVTGCQALYLLHAKALNILLAQPVEVWQKWIPAFVSFRVERGGKVLEAHHEIIKLAYGFFPDLVIDSAAKMLDLHDIEYWNPILFNAEAFAWNEYFAQRIFAIVKAPAVDLGRQAVLIHAVLNRPEPELIPIKAEIVAFVETTIQEYARTGNLDKAPALANQLMLHDLKAWRRTVWPVMQTNAALGRRLVEIAVRADHRNVDVVKDFSEDQLADLYIWVAEQYPHSQDPKSDGYHETHEREWIGDWRDSLLRLLQGKGTAAACQAIGRIHKALPELKWLERVLLQAQGLTRRKTWAPPNSTELQTILNDRSVGLVRSADELLRVVVASLERLQAKLKGVTPCAEDLWNTNPTNRPKDEEALSDYVKRHLNEDISRRGIVANREVKIRDKHGSTSGQHLDICIDAFLKSQDGQLFAPVTVTIESKGNWHRELKTAMETQLVGRYLCDNKCQHGIYLVGWFECTNWDSKDYRKDDVPKKTIEEARKMFTDQAEALSQGGLAIRSVVLDIPL